MFYSAKACVQQFFEVFDENKINIIGKVKTGKQIEEAEAVLTEEIVKFCGVKTSPSKINLRFSLEFLLIDAVLQAFCVTSEIQGFELCPWKPGSVFG